MQSLSDIVGFFFPADQPLAWALNGMVLALFVASLADVIRALTEAKDAEGAVKRLAKVDERERLLASSDDLDARGPVRRRVDLLNKFYERKEPVDGEMLSAISTEAFRDAAPVARFAASGLVLLGLTGTLVGLSLAVAHLSGLLQGAMGAREMATAILATLGDMKIAFSTTLAGVLGALIVGSGIAMLRHRQSAVLRHLEEVSATTWIPLFQTTEESRLSDVLAAVEEANNIFVSQSNQLVREVATLRDATLTILGERGDNSPSLAEYVETVRETTEELQKGVRASGELLPKIQKSLEETIQKEQRALSATLSEHTEAVRPILEKQEAAAQTLQKAISEELARIAELQGLLERLSTSFEAARGTWEEADRAIERMGEETAEAVREGLSGALEGVARLTTAQASSHERMASVLEAFQKSQQQAMHLLGEHSGRALHQTREMVDEIRATVRESLHSVADALDQSQRGTGERVATGINALARELRDIVGHDAPPSQSKARVTRPAPEPAAATAANGDAAAPQPTSAENIRRDLEGLA